MPRRTSKRPMAAPRAPIEERLHQRQGIAVRLCVVSDLIV